MEKLDYKLNAQKMYKEAIKKATKDFMRSGKQAYIEKRKRLQILLELVNKDIESLQN